MLDKTETAHQKNYTWFIFALFSVQHALQFLQTVSRILGFIRLSAPADHSRN